MQQSAKVHYAAPGIAKLSEAQRAPFQSIIIALDATNFDLKLIREKMPEFIAEMKSIASTDDDQARIIRQLDDWVRWHPLGGYYLSFIFQKSMQELQAPSFIAACLLFSDAQNHLAEDLSLNSLENAYTAWKSYYDALGAGPPLSTVEAELRKRLRMTYAYYRRLYSPASYENINPLAECLYFEKAWIDLYSAFPELPHSPQHLDAAALQGIVDRCTTAEDAYCRVVAGRMLGLVHGGSGDFAAARNAYSNALGDARTARLESEIGHLHRLLGFSLMRLGRLDEAEQEQMAALAFEQHPKKGYWQALTLGELGDVKMRRLGGKIDLRELKTDQQRLASVANELAAALQAYAGCMQTFELAIAGSVLPVARAVKQQLMRSFADNAIEVAQFSPGDLVATIEAFGPRYANDLVAEGRVAASLDAPGYHRFRKARAIVHRDLGAVNTNQALDQALEPYLANVVAHRQERRYYLEFRNTHSLEISAPQSVQTVVRQMQALRIPDTLLMLVNVERLTMHVVVVDASTGKPLQSGTVSLEASEWQQAHAVWDAAMQDAKLAWDQNRDPTLAMQEAVEGLLGFYENILAGMLEALAPTLKGKHLKIFPRFLMNQVPLHALPLGSMRLIDVCDVSYAPSLSLFLQLHQDDAVAAPSKLAVLCDTERTSYAATLRALPALANNTAAAERSWERFRASLEQQPASDILLACHGLYDADAPSRSRLFVSSTEAIDFEQLFTDLDLRGCRSAFLGACESGLGRTLVSAEYIGLPMAFFAAGVRYVIATLWQVQQLPAAILVADHYALLLGGTGSVASCLNEAARRLKAMSKHDVMMWVRRFLPEHAVDVEVRLEALGDPPFAHPYYWAGFYVTGDA